MWRRGASRIDGMADLLADTPVVGVEADGWMATARFRTREGDLWVSHVEVEAASPHRITLTHTQRWIPDYLTPGLPADFTGVPMPVAHDAVLIVFGGELLTTLAYRQLSARRSAILDTTSEDQ
jgi:hypothetical protein